MMWDHSRDHSFRIWTLLAVLCHLLPVVRSTSVLFGFQSGDATSGSSYASSMFHDAMTSRLYVTGATYDNYFDGGATVSRRAGDSNCFVGILQLPLRDIDEQPVWIKRASIGKPHVDEACSSIFADDGFNGKKIYLAGHSAESASILSYQKDAAASDKTVYGFLLDLSWSADIVGGHLLQSNAVQYPIAIESGDDTSDVYVVAIESASHNVDTVYETWLENRVEPHPDTTTAGGYLPPQYGSNFAMSLRRLEMNSLSSSSKAQRSSTLATSSNAIVPDVMDEAWYRKFATQNESSVQISDMIKISSNRIVISGSTMGSGTEFGGSRAGFASDGFLTMIEAESGYVQAAAAIHSTDVDTDRVLGLCRSSDGSDLYVVGMTTGNLLTDGTPITEMEYGSYQAFIKKFAAWSLEELWTYQLGALQLDFNASAAQVHGLTCAVTPDDASVYMAGNVKEGASITLNGYDVASESAGGDDVFIAELDSSTGEVIFAEQFGTRHEDKLATNVGLVCDSSGNAILLGNTKGGFLRTDSSAAGVENDLFVVSFHRGTGEHVPFAGDGANVGAGVSTSNTPNGEETNNDSGKTRNGRTFIIAGIVGLNIILATFFVIMLVRKPSGSQEDVIGRYLDDVGRHSSRASVHRSKMGGFKALYVSDRGDDIFNRRRSKAINLHSPDDLASATATLSFWPARSMEDSDSIMRSHLNSIKMPGRGADRGLRGEYEKRYDEVYDLLRHASDRLSTVGEADELSLGTFEDFERARDERRQRWWEEDKMI